VTENGDTKNGSSSRVMSVQGIKDLIEHTFLAGMGAAALTKDRVQELVEDLVSRGQIDKDEGREVMERLVSRSREEARSVLKKADSSLHTAYRELGLSSKQELEEVVLRVQQLEHRVQILEAQADAGSQAKK
jgi:polyhydroxyalkanoate synthesis regulator phasin